MSKKRVYISGRVSGLPLETAKQAFSAKEHALNDAGFEAVNPLRLGLEALGEEAAWEVYMAFDVDLLMTCEAIAMLEGWEKSQGARLELEIAKRHGFEVMI